MYVIQKDLQSIGYFDMYQNAVHVVDGRPWYVSKLTLPTVYDTMEAAEEAQEKLEIEWPGIYKITDAVEYIEEVWEKMSGYDRPLWKEWYDRIVPTPTTTPSPVPAP